MASKLSPVLDVVAGAGELAQSGAESLTEGMSSDAKEALGRRLVDETPEGRLTLGDGAGDIDVWAMKMAQGIGSLVPTLLAGGVTGVAAKASIGRAVTTSMLKRGATQEVAEAVAAKTVSRLATGAAVTTGATGSVGSAGVNTRETVLNMSFDELAASTTFREAFARIDEDQQTQHLSDEDKLALARQETANVASRATISDAKTWGAAAVGSMMGDAMLFKMLAGKMAAGGVLKGAAKGAAGEGISETIEEGVQQYAVNESLNEIAGANIEPMQGVISSALEGGLIGMGAGGVVGSVGGARGGKPMSTDARSAEPGSVVDGSPISPEPPADVAPAASTQESVDVMAEPEFAADKSPLGPSSSQFDELRDVPAYLRRDDTAERFKGMAADSEVQRALAGEFGQSVQELVASQMQAGDQGKSLYERAQAGELGLDPFAGNKSTQQVAMENQRQALPLKDVILAGDANAARGVTKEGHFDDKQAGTGPQFRGAERTRWQSGQEGDMLPPETSSTKPAGELPGAVIEGEAREVGTELPHRDVVYGADQQQSAAKPMRDTTTESEIGPLQTLRITRKGKPFATEKEAAMASRKGKEVPVKLKGGGFGVAELAEVEQVQRRAVESSATNQDDTGNSGALPVDKHNPEVNHDQPAEILTLSSDRQGDQLGASAPVTASSEPSSAELISRTGAGDPEGLAAPIPTPARQPSDDQTLTTPAKDVGVVVSEPATEVEAARAEVDTDPTPAQKEAGNYKKGHLRLHGLNITLENPQGSIRSGADKDGKAWQTTMAHDYGYIKRTEGADGDHVDVFIGDQHASDMVYVFDQVDPKTGQFDEHKAMMGFADEQSAREGYLANYEPGWQGLGAIKAMPVEEFKDWLSKGDTTKPAVVEKGHTPDKIHDFGEKIGGARKDTWAAYRDTLEGESAEQIKALPLSKAWPAPDYDKLVVSGVDPHAVALARAARDAIPAKPRVSYKVSHWAQAVKSLRDLSVGLMDGSIDANAAKRVMSNAGLRSAHTIHNRAELYLAVGHQRSLADLELSLGSYSLFEGVKHDPPIGIWIISRQSKSTNFGHWPRTIASGSSKAEVLAKFKRRYDELTQEVSKPKAISFDIYSRGNRQGWIIGKKVGRNHLDLTEAFDNVSDARKYRVDHYDELVSKLEKAKEIPRERRDINLPRVGEDMRGGEDVTPELFGKAFGFRGVEFGNWVEQDRRQRDLNNAYDALMDMAAVLGISPKSLSLNGELGLAFGARGSGGVNPAAAHYEPGKVVINLTKMNGAGSLGHEWWHALDGYFARVGGETGTVMMTEARVVDLAARGSPYIHRGSVRKEMVEAFGAVNRAIKQTALKERSKKLDNKRSKAYWTTDPELSARAFESYLIAKLQDQGASNDYLANIVSESAWDAEAALGIQLEGSYPYPTAGEIPAIRAGFDQFFDTIEEREEGDKRVLFSKHAIADGDKPAQHLTRKEAELVTQGWFKQYQGASVIDVQIHATQAELEKALGLQPKDGLIRRAAFDDDSETLHVAADTIASPKRMREILRHEVLAHYGLAKVLGSGDYTKLISRLLKSKQEPSMKAVWDWVETHYADEDLGTQAEEVIAHLAELEPSAWRRGWDAVVAWVTRALRAVGFIPDGITPAEIRTLIEALASKMKRPGRQDIGQDGKKFSQETSSGNGRFTPDKTEADNYRQQLAKAMSSLRSGDIAIEVGSTPAVLMAVGAPNLTMRVSRDTVRKAINEVKHDVDTATVEALPELLSDPLAIFDSKTHPGESLVVLLDAKDQSGRAVVTAIQLGVSAGKYLEVNRIASIHGRPDEQVGRWVADGVAKYIKKNHPSSLLTGLQLPLGSSMDGSVPNVLSEDDIVKPGLKFSQTHSAADKAMEKLNLGPKPDIIDKTRSNLAKLRNVDRGVVESWLDRFIKKANTELLDGLAPIKYAEDSAGITDAADSGYVAARMATGAASTMQATMLYGLPEWKDGVIQRKAGTGEKDALLGIFSDLGKDLHNWLGWMAGHRAEILMAQGRENLLDANDIAALKALGNGKEAKFQDAKARWNRLNAATLDLAQDAGLFSKEVRAEFESEWYIPFFRETEDGDVLAPFKQRGIANQNAGIKKLKGGEANTNDLLENIFASTSKLIDASMKNMAAQKTIWNLADTGIIEVVAKPNLMDWRALKNGKNLITVKLEGEDYMIRVEDPDLYRAMTFFDRQPFGSMVNMASKAKRLLTAGVTASPEFMLRNFLRDSLSGWVISKDGFKPVIDSIRGVRKTLAVDGSTIDVMFSGASFLGGYVNGNAPSAMADAVRKSLRRKGMTPEQITRYEKSIIRNAAQAKGVIADAWDKYSRIGEALENANREAVYEAAIKAGKGHAQAAFESKDLMDFSMMGSARFIQAASMVLPFFNARLQGLGKLTREMHGNPRDLVKRAGMITAMSLGLLAINWDDERYEEVPDWDKDANWHFFIGDQHWRIPKPFEIGVLFGTIPERMVRAMGDKDNGAQFGKAVARAIGDTFALNPTPQIVKPLVEAAFNYDTFRGGPIDGPQDLNLMAEARYNEQTSLLMRELGELSGFSPKQLEHLVIGYTGTMGSYVMAAADGLIRTTQPGESAGWRADEIPLLKAIYRGTGPAKSTQHLEEFYQMLNEVNQLKRTIDQYRREGRIEAANTLQATHGEVLKSRQSLGRTQQKIRVVRNKIELIQRDKTLDAEQKRQRIDELLARRNDLAYQAVNKNRSSWE
ncbi:MAG: LPD38 domain-containing protein [Aeromonas veronii]